MHWLGYRQIFIFSIKCITDPYTNEYKYKNFPFKVTSQTVTLYKPNAFANPQQTQEMRHHLVVFHLLVASTCVRAFEDVLCVLEPPITIATETFVCEKPNSKSALDQILNQNVLQDITAASARENAVMQSLPVVTGHTPPFGHSISVAGEGILRNELVHRGIHLQKLMTKWEDTQEYTE